MAEINKITRILLMYSRISQGGKIHKKNFCLETGIDRRTFDRDIEDIRLYLSESFDGNNLIYDRTDESYHMENFYKYKPLTAMEVTFILELLNSSCVLREDEYAGITASLLNAVEINRRRYIKEAVERSVQHYETENRTALLKLHWDLQQCIAERDNIELHFRQDKKQSISPVGIHIYQYQIYLFAYNASEELQVIPIAEILSFKMMNQKYDQSLSERFQKLQREELKTMIEKGRSTNEEN